MLYLSRKEGESIIINDTIELTVVEVRGRTAKLGFDFPADATILRKELVDKIRAQNLEAMATTSDEAIEDITINLDDVGFIQQTDEE